MTFCYTNRSLPCSALIREAASCSDENQHRDLEWYNRQRIRDFGTLSPKYYVFINPLPSGISVDKEGERLLRARGDNSKERLSSRYKRTKAHMNLQRLRQNASRPGSTYTRILAPRGDMDTGPHS